mmetsp:Transcript_82985/g.234397  ORF Transcript_82985/g.234397 Transcript_82985/m.234397 type:complete len:299 (-) Transcript_82985:254-1150(-)
MEHGEARRRDHQLSDDRHVAAQARAGRRLRAGRPAERGLRRDRPRHERARQGPPALPRGWPATGRRDPAREALPLPVPRVARRARPLSQRHQRRLERYALPLPLARRRLRPRAGRARGEPRGREEELQVFAGPWLLVPPRDGQSDLQAILQREVCVSGHTRATVVAAAGVAGTNHPPHVATQSALRRRRRPSAVLDAPTWCVWYVGAGGFKVPCPVPEATTDTGRFNRTRAGGSVQSDVRHLVVMGGRRLVAASCCFGFTFWLLRACRLLRACFCVRASTRLLRAASSEGLHRAEPPY